MKLECKPLLEGIMAYWEEMQEAASYTAILYINDTIISRRTIQRGELYCSFKGLATIDGMYEELLASKIANYIVKHCYTYGIGKKFGTINAPTGRDYYVQIIAENRNGEIIDASEKVKCAVKEF